MALTLLPELKSADTDFLQKMIGYWIHKTYARIVPGYSPSSSAPAISAVPVVLTASSLTAIVGVEFAETNTSFLTPYFCSEDIC